MCMCVQSNDTQVHSKEIHGKELGSPSQDRNGHMYYKSLDWTPKYIEKRFMARNLEAHHNIEMDICTY